jgi:hypothetical protein
LSLFQYIVLFDFPLASIEPGAFCDGTFGTFMA